MTGKPAADKWKHDERKPLRRVVPGAPDPALKGVYGGNCNVTACQLPGAKWWNWGSRAFYCHSCAHDINKFPVDGRVLCSNRAIYGTDNPRLEDFAYLEEFV